MSFFNDEQLTAEAKAKASYRLIGVTTKLSPREVEDIEGLARKHGLQRGEFIRQLILDELARALAGREVEDIEGLARKHGLQRGEFIRQLILDELARDSGDPPVSAELVEILGLRLMLTNLLKPLATGQKITPDVFDGIIAEVKKHKRGLAIKTRPDLICAG